MRHSKHNHNKGEQMNEQDSNINCTPEEEGVYIVIEMMQTANIDGMWFIIHHQYPYLRTERRELDPRFANGFQTCDHHIAIIDGKEYAIPEHVGANTTILKSEIQQDTRLFMEQYWRDQEKDKTRRNLEELPVWDTEETYCAPFYSGEAEKQRMLREAGEEDRQEI